MISPRGLTRRLKLHQLLFLVLLLSGIIPVALSNLLLMNENREIFEDQEKTGFTRAAEALSRELTDALRHTRRELTQLGRGLLAVPGPAAPAARLRQPWVAPYLERFLRANPDLLALRVLDRRGQGASFGPTDLEAPAATALDTAFEQARSHGRPVYRFVVLPATNQPLAVTAVPIGEGPGGPELVVEVLARLHILEAVFQREARGQVGVFLIDRDGQVLWAEGAEPEMQRAVAGSDLVTDFTEYPLNLTAEYTIAVGGRRQRMLGRVSPLEETGWAVVVHKPIETAFRGVERMVLDTLISTAVLVVLALLFAVWAARRTSGPIQRLARTSHEIAAGNFGRRVEVEGPGVELRNLAEDFNRMSGHVQSYVEQLRQAASQNRELFISSIRAFAAAIDAKDPYTRGHSERVAAVSRTIARHLAMPEDFLTRAWVGGVLHDVGKIGIDDRILKKGGVLSAAEYELMKAHPVIGAEIMSPIEPLKDMIPAIRWHHEAWNGRGYPEGLKAEQIPLIARIVAVADCFDAITTSRPYQRAYAPAFAVETITKLAGSRFDAKVVTAFLRAFQAGEIKVREEEETEQAASS
jgi:HD-GYP domain-containing protein (c-di-GMP phosphodiesterase class II)